MRLRLAVFAALFALVYPATLLADTYQYQFSGGSYTYEAQFTFDTASLITAPTTVTPTSCTYNPGGGTTDCDSIQADLFNANFFYLQPTEPWQYAAEFSVPVSLTAIGTQTDILGDTLTITDISSVAATPEPSSIALLGTGMLSLAGMGRRRFAR